MPETIDVEFAALRQEGAKVERGQIAGRVVEEHVLRAGIRSVDAPRCRAGVPLVDGRVELQAGVGAGPGGQADAIPQVARLDLLGDRSEEQTSELQSLMRISYAVFCLKQKK